MRSAPRWRTGAPVAEAPAVGAARPPAPSRGRVRVSRARVRSALARVASVTLVLVAWQAAGAWGSADRILGATPTEVFRAGLGLLASEELGAHALVSLEELGLGFGLALLVGVPLGLAMGRVRRLGHALDPLVMAAYSTPRVALLPVLVLWLGIGVVSKVAVAFLGAVCPVLVNTLAGVRQLDPLWERAVRGFGGRGVTVLTKVVLPGTLPAIMGGLRLGLGRALIGVIVGEMYVSVAGIGQLLALYGNAGRTAELLALAGLVGLVSLAGVQACRVAETRLGPWRRGLEP